MASLIQNDYFPLMYPNMSENIYGWPPAFKEAFFALKWRTYHLEYEAQNAGKVPLSKSESWRGMLGHILLNRARHLYERLFECIIPFGHPLAGRFQHPPNPYIVFIDDHTRTWLDRGDILHIDFTLIGDTINDFPDLLNLLLDMDERKIRSNKSGVRLRLNQFSLQQEEPLFPSESSVFPCDCHIKTVTPLRMRESDCKEQVIPASVWFRRIAERLSLLAHFHSHSPFTEDFVFLEALCSGVENKAGNLRWENQQRYSSRHRGSKPAGGFSGSWEYGHLPISLWPILKVGEHLHIGKATVQGMGKYKVEVSPAAE